MGMNLPTNIEVIAVSADGTILTVRDGGVTTYDVLAAHASLRVLKKAIALRFGPEPAKECVCHKYTATERREALRRDFWVHAQTATANDRRLIDSDTGDDLGPATAAQIAASDHTIEGYIAIDDDGNVVGFGGYPVGTLRLAYVDGEPAT